MEENKNFGKLGDQLKNIMKNVDIPNISKMYSMPKVKEFTKEDLKKFKKTDWLVITGIIVTVVIGTIQILISLNVFN